MPKRGKIARLQRENDRRSKEHMSLYAVPHSNSFPRQTFTSTPSLLRRRDRSLTLRERLDSLALENRISSFFPSFFHVLVDENENENANNTWHLEAFSDLWVLFFQWVLEISENRLRDRVLSRGRQYLFSVLKTLKMHRDNQSANGALWYWYRELKTKPWHKRMLSLSFTRFLFLVRLFRPLLQSSCEPCTLVRQQLQCLGLPLFLSKAHTLESRIDQKRKKKISAEKKKEKNPS